MGWQSLEPAARREELKRRELERESEQEVMQLVLVGVPVPVPVRTWGQERALELISGRAMERRVGPVPRRGRARRGGERRSGG